MTKGKSTTIKKTAPIPITGIGFQQRKQDRQLSNVIEHIIRHFGLVCDYRRFLQFYLILARIFFMVLDFPLILPHPQSASVNDIQNVLLISTSALYCRLYCAHQRNSFTEQEKYLINIQFKNLLLKQMNITWSIFGCRR